MNDQYLTQLFIAGATTQLMEWVKRWTAVPWITTKTDVLNRWIGMAVAFLMGLGITFTYDHNAHTLLIAGLDWTTIGHAVWTMLVQWVMQQGWYKGVVSPATVTVVTPPKGGK